MRQILRGLLQQIGFTNVDEASDSGAALAKLCNARFRLVISDWNMEPMVGFQLLQEIRADDRLDAMPFIMVTAESNNENDVAAKQAGVRFLITRREWKRS